MSAPVDAMKETFIAGHVAVAATDVAIRARRRSSSITVRPASCGPGTVRSHGADRRNTSSNGMTESREAFRILSHR
ncbi:hypothetical protein [Burkholderia sp. NRF60-BP8]|uniref:hypothetical protein n=1 Tax=Burkholderia sp. NRF60-BP8 TaxID=1637853 RepID=UPI000A498CFC|nr:hypothetical protein [Burkholderia sp. NRF60-BP8]